MARFPNNHTFFIIASYFFVQLIKVWAILDKSSTLPSFELVDSFSKLLYFNAFDDMDSNLAKDYELFDAV